MTTAQTTKNATESKTLAVFSQAAANLSVLEEMLSDAVVNLDTEQGLNDCKDAAKKMQKLRTGVENTRLEENREAREHIKNVNHQAKIIQERIEPLEVKFKKPLDERKQTFLDELKKIDESPERCTNKDSGFISEVIAWLESIDPNEKAEYKKEFKASIFTAADKVTDLFMEAVKKEEEEKKAEEQRKQQEEAAEKAKKEKEKLEKAAEIQQRLTTLQQIPLGLMGKKSKVIKAKIESLKAYKPTEEDFQDRLPETIAAKDQVISQLEMMLQMQLNTEKVESDSNKQAAIEKAKRDNELHKNKIMQSWQEAHDAAKESNDLLVVDKALTFLTGEHQHLEYWSSDDYFAGNDEAYNLILELSSSVCERLEALKAQQQEELPETDKHKDDCQGCPDCQGINCAITEEAAKREIIDDEVTSSQDTAAQAICEKMLGCISYDEAIRLVSFIKSGDIPHVTFIK